MITFLLILVFLHISNAQNNTENKDQNITGIKTENKSNIQVGTVISDEPGNTRILISDTLPWSCRMAETLLISYPEIWQMEGGRRPYWSYTFGLVGLAMEKLYVRTGMEKYYDYTKNYIDKLIDDKGIIRTYRLTDYNIDQINSGKTLFMLYERTKDERYKTALDTLRKQLLKHPRTKTGGFWHKKRYPHQMWLDGVYMGAPFMAQYAEEFKEPGMFDDLINWIRVVEKNTRDSLTGLLYHGWDESRQQKWSDTITGVSSQFWGRGVGWYAMALVDVLDYIPPEHQGYNDVIAVLNRLSEAVIKVQDKKTGIWYQVLDQGGREGNYLEGSVSCMLTYTLLKAVRMGYIDKKYLETAVRAYRGITQNLIKVNKEGLLTISPVCAVAGLGGNPYRDGSYEYYINEKQRDNDPKATGPFILASLEYEAIISE